MIVSSLSVRVCALVSFVSLLGCGGSSGGGHDASVDARTEDGGRDGAGPEEVGCGTEGVCGPFTPACVDDVCKECGVAADCAHSFFGHVCGETNVCGCNASSDCAPGMGCRDGACEIGCSSDSDCHDGWSSICDLSTSLCVVCVDDADCADNGMATSGYGSVCLENRTCGCNTSDDCVGNAFGTECVFGICDVP